MAGIAHLQEIYKKKGKDFIENLFDKYVTVNEKLDASAFGIEKNPATKKLEFFKRNTEMPISLIDRTLMKLYEQPISYFEKIEPEVLAKIPARWRFGMEYFANDHPQEISYDRLPKNQLVLSYIHVKNSNGKLVRTIQDKKELDSWADLLQIERSPILYQGNLTEDQKIKIMDFLDTPFEKLVNKFKTNSFVKFVISVLNPKLKKTTLNDDLDKNIEGIVFRFGDEDDKEVILAKMVDPVFELMAKGRAETKNEDEPNDIFQLTVIDIMNFIDNLSFKKFQPKGKELEARYLTFICQVFNEFIEKFGDKYKDLNFNEPEFMKKKNFDINLDFIKNDKTIELINENEAYKKLFKIFLASFRKKKKKPNGIFTIEVIKQFNGTIDRIHNHLSQGVLSVSESETAIPTFGEFKLLKGSYIEDEVDNTEVDNFVDFGKQVMDEDAPEEETEEPKEAKPEGEVEEPEAPKKREINTDKGSKKVNIIVGRFQPFHNGHLSMAKDLYDFNKYPVVIVVVHPGHNKSGQSPFTLSTIKTMMSNLSKDSDGMIKDHCIIGRGFIYDVINKLRELNYEPILWGAGEDRIQDYKKQLELNFKRENELKLGDNFQLVKTDRYGSGTEVRKAIEEDKFGEFKALVPKTVQGVYTLLRNDIENAKREAEEAALAKKQLTQ
jgi:cytidyltransferase-like protein